MIDSYNGIPIYRAALDSEDTGMIVVSLVDAPAIESDFLAFNKQETLQFSIQDEEQRMVLGPVMIPNRLIYRETADGMPYYIKYEANTIHKMAEKYFADRNINNVDTDHSFELVDGVTLVQAFFKNVEKGINPVGFEDLPDDTLFFQYHVNSDEIWNGVKEGTWKGFSLAGTFDVVPVELQKTNKKENKYSNMSKLERIKTMLKNVLMAFERISTDHALLEVDDEFVVGASVWGINEDNERYDLEDGEYKADDQTVYVIKEGKIDEIIIPETIEEPAEEPAVEEVIEEVAAEDAQESEEVAEEEPQADPRDERIANLEAEISRLTERIGELTEENGQLRARVKELEEAPVALSATEEFEQITKVGKTGNEKLDKLVDRFRR